MNTDTIQATEKIWHLESIDLSKVFQDVRVAHLNETIDSKNFAINGQSFACGIGTMANSDIHLALDGKARCIRGICGVDDESETFGAAEFIIRSRDNGDVLWRSGIRRRGDEPVHFNISLDNARGIALQLISVGDGHPHYHGDWIGVEIVYTGDVPQSVDPEFIIATANLGWRFHAARNQMLMQTGFGLHGTKVIPQESFSTYPGRCFERETFTRPYNLYVVQSDGAHDLELLFQSVEQEKVSDNITQTVFVMADPAYPIEVRLVVTSFYNEDMFVVHRTITNTGHQPVQLYNRDSVMVALPKRQYYLTNINGNWGREMGQSESLLPRGIVEHCNTLFAHNVVPDYPGCFLSADHPAREEEGEVFAAAIAWSSQWQYKVTRLPADDVLFSAGVYATAVTLNPGETNTSPKVLMTYSGKGKGQISRNFHRYMRRYGIAHGMEERPVILNSWEGVYMNFNEEKVLEMIRNAADLGVEMYVLDDGWFGNRYPRNIDNAGLGDWQVNVTKLPGGLERLIEECDKYGMKFGLWFEPEMVNPWSELFEKHPDWVMRSPRRCIWGGRSQYAPDLSKPEVEEHVINSVAGMLRQYPGIRYIKWDQNMLTLNTGAPHLRDNQGALGEKFGAAYYRVLTRLKQEFPDVLFQLCASGGGRVDVGAMQFHDEFWASDITNGILRIPIQWGFSHFFPANTIAAHIGRLGEGDFKLRCDVAMTARLGVELSPDKVSEEDREVIRRGIAVYKKLRPFLHSAELYRGRSPYESQTTELAYVAQDRAEAVFFAFKRNHGAEIASLRVPGIDPARSYQVTEVNPDVVPRIRDGVMFGADLLAGRLTVAFPEKPASVVVHLTAVE